MKVVAPFERPVIIGKRINTAYETSITKDSTVAVKASANSVKNKMAFRCAQLAFSVD